MSIKAWVATSAKQKLALQEIGKVYDTRWVVKDFSLEVSDREFVALGATGIRAFGKLIFATVQDAAGRLQFSLSIDHSGPEVFALFNDCIDIQFLCDLLQRFLRAFVSHNRGTRGDSQ